MSLNRPFLIDDAAMTCRSTFTAEDGATTRVDPAARVMAWADALASHSEHPDHLTCTYLTPAHRATAQQLEAWMVAAGFDAVRHDAVGNVIGRYRADPAVPAPALVCTGSHYDTVCDAGRYDARLGILLPMAVVGSLSARGQRLPYDLEVVAFAAKEDVRFDSTFLGARAYAGRLDAQMLDSIDADGVPMRDAMAMVGLHADRIDEAGVDQARLAHYFEVHIEQGPVLRERNLPVGVVTAIMGCVRKIVTLTGQADRAGTTPMGMRRDAACAAAKALLFVERRSARDQGLVGTVGQLEVAGGAVDIVPGSCRYSLDIRAPDDVVRDAAVADIDEAIHEICSRRNIHVDSAEVLRSAAIRCDSTHQDIWAQAIAAQGLDVLAMPSGVDHNAVMMARVAPVSMLFVRSSNGGDSHSQLETVSAEDVGVAARVLEHFLTHRLGR